MADVARPAAHGEETTRRDFLSLAGTAIAGIGAAVVAWPLIDSMNPSADVIAAGAPVDIDISHVALGQQIKVLWRGRTIFIVHRSPEQLAMLKDAQDLDKLSDPNSTVVQQPDYAKNAYRSVKPELLVLIGICTHLGCIPNFTPDQGALDPTWPGGYFCPCHGSKYDLAGRVFKNVPAPYNLPVPPYHYVSDGVIRIGENPPNSDFDLNSIAQM